MARSPNSKISAKESFTNSLSLSLAVLFSRFNFADSAMYSGENPTGSTAAMVQKTFFCYQCNRTVTTLIFPNADPFCPRCNGGFLEEYENPNPNQTPNFNPSGFPPMSGPLSSLLPLLFGGSALPSSDGMEFMNPNLARPSIQPRSTQQQTEAFDSVIFLRNHLQHPRFRGTNVQFVFADNPSNPGNRMPGNFGDYFLGPGFEQLIQQLAENDPNRYGTPPASKSAIDALPTVKVTRDMLKSEMNQCVVCMDEFEDGIDLKQMPCKHVFHQDGLLPWLQLHNSCPVCRYELPTDDPDYENRTQSQGIQTSRDAQGSVQRQQRPMRFTIQLSLPFMRQDGSGSEPGSGSGAPGSGGGGANL